ncbi:MAG: hypothetical protein HC875_16130 [Anaerolineales bacterium]|nr:hypothetical protein [Anaerolineales bacterium]
MEVNFTGTLPNESGENRENACQEGRFEFGDGNSLSVTAATCDPEKKRGDVANYVYDEPGEYQATYAVGRLKSEPLTIIVRGSGDTPSPTDTATTIAVQPTTIAPQPTEAPLAEATPVSPTPTPAASKVETSGASLFNVWTLLLLPLLGLAVGWFIWGRGRN